MQFTECVELDDAISLTKLTSKSFSTSARKCYHTGDELSHSGHGRRREIGHSDIAGRPTMFRSDQDLMAVRFVSISPPENTFLSDSDDGYDCFGRPRVSSSSYSDKCASMVREQAVHQKSPSFASPSDTVQFVHEAVVEDTNCADQSVNSEKTQFSSTARDLKSGIRQIFGIENSTDHEYERRKEQNLNTQFVGPGIDLNIYLPDTTLIKLRVTNKCTVANAIQKAINYDMVMHFPRRLCLDPGAYEIRCHEENGTPDMDLLALDSELPVKNFSEGMGGDPAVLCLCDKHNFVSNDLFLKRKGVELQVDKQAELLREKLIKVYVPENKSFMTFMNDQHPEGLQAFKLLSLIQAKQVLPLFAEEYQFTLPDLERERLGLDSEVVPMERDIVSAGIRHLILCRKQYDDAPRVDINHFGLNRVNSANSVFFKPDREAVKESRRKHDERSVYRAFGVDILNDRCWMDSNDVTLAIDGKSAVLYEQWDAVKITYREKPKRWIIGMDSMKLVNKQHKDSRKLGIFYRQKAQGTECSINDVKAILISKDNCSAIQIILKDASGHSSGRPTVYILDDGPAAATYIMAKFKCIRDQNLSENSLVN